MTDRSGPRAEYTRRRDERLAEAQRLARRERWLSHARLVVFVGGALAAWFAFGAHWLPRSSVLPFLVAFGALAFWHDRSISAREQADRAVAWYERGLARIDDRWSGGGQSGEGFRDPAHAYAEDLDLFGEGSLFELLCSARTPMGEATLAGWLGAASSAETVRERQAAIGELRPALALREDLASLASEAATKLEPRALVRWGERPTEAPGTARRVIPAIAAATSVATLSGWILGMLGGGPFVLALLAQAVIAFVLRAHSRRAVEGLDGAARALGALAALLERLQAERFDAARLAALRETLASRESAAHEIARLRRLTELLDARRNQLFMPIAALLSWGTQLSLAIEAWRARCGPQLRGWLEAVGEIEALTSISAYAYENPDDPFPDLSDGPALFDAQGLGHPLIPIDACVRNDIVLDQSQPARIVSGSNMSGKSTWLRSVGIAAAMAQAGAPVRARRLTMSPLSIGASLRILDSLQTGTSHFYAEIRRLRQIVDLADGERPLLFLLDEILHGTNSHDRRIGAEAIVRGLVERGALGLVTTHDLALARIADQLAPRVQNLHFADRLEGGQLHFDYRLSEGVVTRSNALELMREVGLDV